MGYITKNWSGFKNSLSLSEKVLDKVKPGTSLKNRLQDSQKKLQLQISKLEETHKKLQLNHDHVFKKIVDAKMLRNESKARSYAIELQELRKVKKMIGGAKLAMEQIKIRLNTITELGDVVVTLSPCMSLIKGLAPSLSSFMPGINSSMQDMSNMLNDLMSSSSLPAESAYIPNETNQDITAILEEAHTVLEGKTKSNMPEPPTANLRNLTKETESLI